MPTNVLHGQVLRKNKKLSLDSQWDGVLYNFV